MTRVKLPSILLYGVISFSAIPAQAEVDDMDITYPETEKIPVVETIHGTAVVDDYRWLEDGADPKVRKWEDEQMELTGSILEGLPQREFLINRLDELWRYDSEGLHMSVPDSDRLFFWKRGKDDEKDAYYVKDGYDGKARKVLDPNEWDEVDALLGFYPSRDGQYVA
ncbi:MAG: hypothetical protein GY771_07025, partial [bacterium]|nr:hypothetical protein [bacterium]